MANYGQLDSDNVCTVVIVADSSPGSDWVEITDVNAGVGWTYDKQSQTWSQTLEPPTAEENKDRAYAELVDCDWTQLPDVGLTLSNVGEWRTYRATLREIVKNPTAGQLTWPDKPDEEYV